MKKNVLCFIITTIIVIIIIFPIAAFINNLRLNKNTNKIKVAEVTHSIFYTPFYVAIECGYFKDEGIDIELILTSGSDNVAASVLSNDTHIGLAGPESAIFVYLGGERDYLQVFSGLTKRDGQFIVSRNKKFKWEDLTNKEILTGRNNGMPYLSFIKALENENINKKDLNINTSVEFAELAGSFIGGNGDYVNLFEPLATKLEKEGKGFVVSSVGLYSDEIPYTAFYARKSYIKENKEMIKKFIRAIERGMKYTKYNKSDIIAHKIRNQFPDTDTPLLSEMIERYKNADVWLDNSKIFESSFNKLTKILYDNKLINNDVYYSDLVISIND